MTWVLIAVAGWIVLAIGSALLIGRAIALADRRSGESLNFIVDLEMPVFPDGAPAAAEATPPAQPPTDQSVVTEQINPGPSTVPSIPSARPPLPEPPVPRSTRARSRREAG